MIGLNVHHDMYKRPYNGTFLIVYFALKSKLHLTCKKIFNICYKTNYQHVCAVSVELAHNFSYNLNFKPLTNMKPTTPQW